MVGPVPIYELVKKSRAGGPVTCVALAPSSLPGRNPSKFIFAAQGPYVTRYSVSFRGDRREERLSAFPDGGTIHGIKFLLKESICDNANRRGERPKSSSGHLWDSVVYGGNKVSFCNLLSFDDKLVRLDVKYVATEFKECTSCLTLSDWILTVKSICNAMKDEVSIVVGFARHFIEVWNLVTEISSCEYEVKPRRLQRLFLRPSTMVTSMDVFVRESGSRLWIAAGTSFFRLWISSVDLTGLTVGKCFLSDSSCLLEHAGVVHSVKFSKCGYILVSSSDDRSVRKWKWDEASKLFKQDWIGWGHTARVWSVVFASDDEFFVSVSEDGTARVWSAACGATLATIHYGAPSCSLWVVDAIGKCMVMGATDGIVVTHNLEDRIIGRKLRVLESVPIPDDRPKSAAFLEAPIECSSREQEPPKKKKTKKKVKTQVVVGIQWWHQSSSGTSSLLVATRQGSLYLLDTSTQKWEDLQGWCNSSLLNSFGIRPYDGCCMAVQTIGNQIAFGTVAGYIVLMQFIEAHRRKTIVLDGNSHRSVQGLKWLKPTCLISFHIRAVVLWDLNDDFSDNTVMFASMVFSIETKGIPICCAYDEISGRMVVGDSRGSLSLFSDRSETSSLVAPMAMLPRVHQKERINFIQWLDSTTVLSAGNDGCCHVSYAINKSLYQGWGFPVSAMTSVTKMAASDAGTVYNPTSVMLLGGYYGNDFCVSDVLSGHEFIQVDTGGRQRILEFIVAETVEEPKSMPKSYDLAVCMGLRDGSNSVFVQQLLPDVDEFPSSDPEVALGEKLHGETIFGSAFFCMGRCETQFLVTASEDCTTRISAWKDGTIIDSLILTRQPSCVRCVCSSQIDERSALLVMGGGKLVIQFFLVQSWPVRESKSVHDLRITYIGKGVTGKKGTTSIDHRINAVTALVLDDKERIHLVMAGDSNGLLHLFVMTEQVPETSRWTMGIKVPTGNRPILCIEAIVVFDRIICILGTTNGQIQLFDFPTSTAELCKDATDSWTLLATYQAHSIGTNCITSRTSSSASLNGIVSTDVTIVSGGDDHSLCFAHLSVGESRKKFPLLLLKDPTTRSVLGASFSAIKSVFHIILEGKSHILSVGYSQTLALWNGGENNENQPQLLVSKVAVDLGDVNCMAAYLQPRGVTQAWIAVCGMGVEVFELCLHQ